MLLRDDLLLAMTRLDACDDACSWLTACPACTFADLWDACPRGDWLLWLAGRLPGLEAQVGRATAAVARLALAAIPDEHPGAGELREIVRVGAEVAEAGSEADLLARVVGVRRILHHAQKSGALHDCAFMLFNYNDGNLEEAIGHVGLLLAELDPTSAYEVAWGVGDCLLDVTRGSIDEQRVKVLTHTADAVRSVLGAEEVEEALASFLWSRPGAGVAA